MIIYYHQTCTQIDRFQQLDLNLELSKHTTLYGLLMKDVGNVNAYFKANYLIADIRNVKANYATRTVNLHNSSLEGQMIGVGLPTDIDVLVGKLELIYTDYHDVSVKPL